MYEKLPHIIVGISLEKDTFKPAKPCDYWGFRICLYYTIRGGGIVGLRWESINFEANTITIEHTVTVATIAGKNVIVADDTTKTKSSYRTLPLIPIIQAKLLEVLAEQEKNRQL